MSQFHSLDGVLAQDDAFREFFTALSGIAAGGDRLNGANSANMLPAGGSDATMLGGSSSDTIWGSSGNADWATTHNSPLSFGGGDGSVGAIFANLLQTIEHMHGSPGLGHSMPMDGGSGGIAPVSDPAPVISPAPVMDPAPVASPTPVSDPAPVTTPAPAGTPITLSDDFATSHTDAGPYWAMNSTWNEGSLVNGTDFTQSLTLDSANLPNNTTITWSWPNTPAGFNVYSYPAVFYGDYAGFPAPATSVTAEQVNNIHTLTLSQNVSLSGQTDQYDAMYDGYLTSTPDGGQSDIQHEIEVYVHQPSYVQDWISNLPQHSFTDGQGMQWTIATSGNIVVFAPTNGQDLTNNTIDLKGLLQAAAADGVISGNEYFDGIALGNEPREGSGSMTIHSFAVNYDGDSHAAATTAATPLASAATTAAAVLNPTPVSHTAPATDPAPATSPAPATTSSSTTASVEDASATIQHHQDAASAVQAFSDVLSSLAHQQAHSFAHMWG